MGKFVWNLLAVAGALAIIFLIIAAVDPDVANDIVNFFSQ